MFKQCPKCETPVMEEIQCPNCQLVFAKYLELEQLKKNIKSEQKEIRKFQDEVIESQKFLLLILPIVLLIAFMVHKSLFRFFFLYFKVWTHEFGHALMSWMSGVKATPISFGTFGFTFNSDPERSIVVFISFAFLMMVLFFYGRKEKSFFLSALAALTLLSTLVCTWILPSHGSEELIIMAGFAGELVLSSLMISSFYHRFPRKWHWEHFWRWPILLIGSFILIDSSLEWMSASNLKSLSTFGTNYAEEFGDLNRLLQNHDWSFKKFMRVYLSLVAGSWVLVIGHYAYFLKRSFKS